MERSELVELIMTHYHRALPAWVGLNDEQFFVDKSYQQAQLINALGVVPSRLKDVVKRGGLILVGGEVPGYEARRKILSPSLGRIIKYENITRLLFIGRNVIDRLVELKVLHSEPGLKGTYISMKDVRDLFAEINPAYRSDKYQKLSGILGDGKGYDDKKRDDKLIQIVKESPSLDRLYKNQEIQTIPQDRVLFVVGKDYALCQARLQHPDAFYVREAIEQRRGKPVTALNRRDYFRLCLARVSEPEEEFARRVVPYDREQAIRKLEIARMHPILYDGEFVLLPGSDKIIRLEEAALLQFADLVQPIIERHGPFMAEGEIQSLVGDKFRKDKLYQQRDIGNISSKMIRNAERFNTFQVAMFYYGYLKR